MRDLSKVTGDKALDFWMDIFEPFTTIVTSEEVEQWRLGKRPGVNLAQLITEVIKKYKKEVWQVLSAFHGKSVTEVKKSSTPISLLNDVMEILNADGFKDFFAFAVGAKIRT